MTNFLPPPLAVHASEPLSPAQQFKRAPAESRNRCSTPDCQIEVHIGVFFDGTNNNMERDKLKIQDPNKRSHSNIVVLHDTFANKRDFHYRIYLPGVGTPFEQIGEFTESSDGKAMARGGEARIHWAMIQVINSLNTAILKDRLVKDDEAKRLVIGPSFLAGEGLLPCPSSRRRGVFHEVGRRLASNLRIKASPSIRVAHLHVFGFSRGAAESRTFCNWMNDLCEPGENGRELYGVPLRFRFVGLFDTVASVGVANSAPVPNDGGFLGWADGTMELPACIERCVHYTAAHEIRKSFPLSTGRKSRCTVEEVIYPGSHSDVGGGYAPGEQGKGRTRAELLSQVPLVHMYNTAIAAGVPLMLDKELLDHKRGDTIDDLKLSPSLIGAFNDYRRLGPGGGEIRKAMFEHLRLYWRWRLAVGNGFKSLASYQAASAQDKEDLEASEADFLRDVQIAERDEAYFKRLRGNSDRTKNPEASSVAVQAQKPKAPGSRGERMLRDLVQHGAGISAAEEAVRSELRTKSPVPHEIALFFDRYVHDSHATFYLLGPVTAADKKALIDSVKQKKERDLKALNGFERRVYEYQRTNPGQLPIITDSNYVDLLEREDVGSKATIFAMTRTRRESEGHVRERVIFDRS